MKSTGQMRLFSFIFFSTSLFSVCINQCKTYFLALFGKEKLIPDCLCSWLLLLDNWMLHDGGYRTYSIRSSLQILRVMASWLRGELLLSFSHCFFLPPPMVLPFCHVCCGTYRVAAGFLFSGNVLDDWKATWSDLRDTTCRRFIISFFFF